MQGHAIGAGFQLALACDLRVFADDAQLRMAEATLGLVPDLAGTSTLVELVGYCRALEICLTGRPVGAAEALAIGLATLVVPAPSWTPPSPTCRRAAGARRGARPGDQGAAAGAAGRNDPEEQDAAERAAQVRRLRDAAPRARGTERRGTAGDRVAAVPAGVITELQQRGRCHELADDRRWPRCGRSAATAR